MDGVLPLSITTASLRRQRIQDIRAYEWFIMQRSSSCVMAGIRVLAQTSDTCTWLTTIVTVSLSLHTWLRLGPFWAIESWNTRIGCMGSGMWLLEIPRPILAIARNAARVDVGPLPDICTATSNTGHGASGRSLKTMLCNHVLVDDGEENYS